MEERTPIVRRKNMDSGRSRPQNDHYITMPGQFTCRTWKDSENYRAGRTTKLVAKNERNN